MRAPLRSIPVLVVALLVGCVNGPPSASPPLPAAPQVSWPAPPASAHVSHLLSVSNASDWGIVKSVWRRVWERLTGSGNESIVRPMAAVAQSGVLYVADPGVPALWIFDAPQGESRRVTQLGDDGSLTLVSPVAVALRPDGSVYVADTVLKKVLLIDRHGQLLGVAAENGLERPAGLAYSAATQKLYVADAVNNHILVFDPNGKLLQTWGMAGSDAGQFNRPTHLALGRDSTLLVTDALNFRVQAFDLDGRFLWKLGRHGDGSGDFAAPKGVAADNSGHIFVVDALFDAVQIFDPDGALLLALGQRGQGSGQFWLPGGISIDSGNRVYVADAYNRRVQVLQILQVEPATSAVSAEGRP